MFNDIRKFWLINGQGHVWNITDESTLASNPEGLGASASVSMMKLGDMQATSTFNWELNPISFELIFAPRDTNADVYNLYDQFFDFLAQRPLKLHYQTPNRETSMYKKVTLKEITKGEIDIENYLSCNVTLIPHHLWISDNESIVEINTNEKGGKIYPLHYPFSYSLDSYSNISVYSKSSVEVPLIVEIYGDVVNPRFDVFDGMNQKYGSCKMNGTFNYVYINSNDLEEEVVLRQDESFIYNAISRQDMTVGIANQVYVTFVKLKPGQNYIEFEFDNTFNGSIVIKWRDYRVS